MPSKRPSRRGDEIRAGDLVSWPVPWGSIDARVVEDRGNIGVRGRRLVRIRTLDELEDARIDFEVPAQAVSKVPGACYYAGGGRSSQGSAHGLHRGSGPGPGGAVSGNAG